jgi:hypothetical protein
MDPLEGDTHSFVIKIWAERHAPPAVWQGNVTHVASGRRRSFRNLRAITAFIGSYLQSDPHAEKLPVWLSRWKRKPPGTS